LTRCFECTKNGDKHHIIHKEEGGLEYPLNTLYLCEEHHRGPTGPHKDPVKDRQYKKALYDALASLFTKEHYELQDIRTMAKLSSSLARTLRKTLKRQKEGYRTMDILDFLMSGYQLQDEELDIPVFEED